MCFRLACFGHDDVVYNPPPRMNKPAPPQHNGRYNTGGNGAYHAAAEAGRKASNDVRKGGHGHAAVPAGAVAKARDGHAAAAATQEYAGANDDAALKQHQHAAWNSKVAGGAGAGDAHAGHYYNYPPAHREDAAELYYTTTAAAHHGSFLVSPSIC
ncbi:hypothetical protein BS78_03G070900 [Paspalum vaginatum]|nr:hypothetical protein BS78_03G070900 [Paspalum vaginatum]